MQTIGYVLRENNTCSFTLLADIVCETSQIQLNTLTATYYIFNF